jgi:predicted permease
MNGWLQDLRFSVRQMRKSPGFALTALLSLALGIGATTAIFSVIYAVLVDPYPYKDADRMVHVQLNDVNSAGEPHGPLLVVNGSEYQELRRSPYIEDVFLQQNRTEIWSGNRFPISVLAGHYSPNLFTFMAVPPLFGREFTPADAPDGKPAPVAVLSYRFWKAQFGSNQDVLSKTIELNHKLYTIVGVAPPRFTWGDCDLYMPAVPSADPHDYWLSFIRLKPHTNYKAAQANIQSLLNAFVNDDPKDFRRNKRAAIVSLNEEVLGRFSGTLVLLFVAVLALLIIGCSNVSILLLARGIRRQHELAMRASIGATRGRLIRQLLAESVLLSLTGAVLGVIAAYGGVQFIASFLPFYSFPHEAAIHVSVPVLVFTVAIAFTTGILFGISPAWELSKPHISELLQAGSSRHSASTQGRASHRMLIAGQVALTLLLLAGAGAATQAFLSLIHVPLGFDPDHLASFDVALPKGANPTWEARLNANEALLQAIERVPGVISATISPTWQPPFGGFMASFELRSDPTLTNAQVMLGLVSRQEFSTLRIRLLAGRLFTDEEIRRGAHVALVNRAFVKQYLAGHLPIGERVRSSALKVEQPDLLLTQAPDDWLEVVGAVEDARNDGLERPTKPAIFLPYSFVLPPDQFFIIRSAIDPEAALASIKQRLRDANPEIVVNQDHTLAWWLYTQGWGQGRFIATLFSIFAALALALAATGLYSVVSYAVSERTQEVGIRMALGAPRANIVRLVAMSTAFVLSVGLLLGLGLSVALSKTVAAWAGGGSPRDPLTLLGSALLLIVVSAIACLVPAWRAATSDPVEALRYE